MGLAMISLIVIIIVAHELGHIVGYYYYLKKWPPITFKWGAILVGGYDYDKSIYLSQKMNVIGIGIITGFIPALWLSEMISGYFLVCALDLLLLYIGTWTYLKHGNLTIDEITHIK